MRWRKYNRVLHRDLGYFFFGMCVIYGLSGIALNHIDDWDPNYSITTKNVSVEPDRIQGELTRSDLVQILDDLKINNSFKQQYSPSGSILKIFVKNGSVTLSKVTGLGVFEEVKRRPIFYEVNFLHYNNLQGFQHDYSSNNLLLPLNYCQLTHQ